MAHLTTVGGARVWIAEDWADFQTLCGAADCVLVGDRCLYVPIGAWLTFRTSTTRAAVSKNRWIPDDTETFGANDRSTVPFGSIDDDGIWSVSAGTHTFAVANLQDTWDVLGLVLSSGLGAVDIDGLAAPSGTGPHALQIRGLYLSVSGGTACSVGMDGCGFAGGAGGTKGAPATAGTAVDQAADASDHGQFAGCASGGGGGGGGGGSVA